MASTPPRRPLLVLIVEDSEDDAVLLFRELRRGGYEPTAERVETAEALIKALRRSPWDVIISDYVLPGFGGREALTILHEMELDLPFIIVSGNIGEGIAVEAMKAGAHDYIMKDNLRRLVPAVERELREAEVRRGRESALRELRETKELLEKIFSSTRVMVAYLDSGFTIRRVNQAFADAFAAEGRRTPESYAGLSALALFPDETAEIFREVLETGRPYSRHAKRVDPPGMETSHRKPIFCDWSLQPAAVSPGRMDGLVLSLMDITKEVELERGLQQAQRMEELGTLAGGIAHDFNNVLTAIVINTELTLFAVTENEAAAEHLGQVLKAARRGKELARQVLTFSSRTEGERRPVRIAPLIREAVAFLRASLPSRIEIRQSVTTSSDVVMADPTQIHQVLMNLGSNAGHAMREKGGILEIALEAAEVDGGMAERYPGLKPGPHVRLTVSDTGCGIPADVLPRIFDPFFTTKEPEEGTGMGLPMVHGIVNGYGGIIIVDTREGQGTAFQILLPRESDEGAGDTACPPESRAGPSESSSSRTRTSRPGR